MTRAISIAESTQVQSFTNCPSLENPWLDAESNSYEASVQEKFEMPGGVSERIRHFARFFFELLENVYFLLSDLVNPIVSVFALSYEPLKGGVILNRAVDLDCAREGKESVCEYLSHIYDGIQRLKYAFEDHFYPRPEFFPIQPRRSEPLPSLPSSAMVLECDIHDVPLPPDYFEAAQEVGHGILPPIPEEYAVDYSDWFSIQFEKMDGEDPSASLKERSIRFLKSEVFSRLAAAVDVLFVLLGGLWKASFMTVVRAVNLIEKGGERLWKGVVQNRPNVEITYGNGKKSEWLYESFSRVEGALSIIHEFVHGILHTESSPNQLARFPNFSMRHPMQFAEISFQTENYGEYL